MARYNASTVFMLAPQRHGSNKTQSMLASNNPALFGPYPPIPRRAFKSLETRLGKGLLDAMVQNANMSPRPLVPDQPVLTGSELRHQLDIRNLPEDSLGISIALTLLAAKKSGQTKAMVLCKSPDNLEIAERHLHELENAAFIHVIRDPRAVWNSGRGTPRGPQTPHAAALNWADYHSRVLKLAESTPLVSLRYEDLMLNPESELRRACDFLGIPFHRAMLEDHGSDAMKQAAMKNPGLWGNLAKPIQQDRTTAWARELPSDEIDIIDNTCRKIMTTFDYEPMFTERKLSLADIALRPDTPPPPPDAEPRKEQLLHINQLKEFLPANTSLNGPHSLAS